MERTNSSSIRTDCMAISYFYNTATDDPSRMVTVTASDGKSGDEKIISYTSCKVVGNGSFGVVFAARMMGEKQADGSEGAESDIAIKKVLQDKRFKASDIHKKTVLEIRKNEKLIT
jgi:hypothetical protein